jgi:uncharacterized protein
MVTVVTLQYFVRSTRTLGMDGRRWVQMDDTEIDKFLGRGGTSVLSFAAGIDASPVSIPVSYGYNDDTETIYFQLSLRPGSEKAALVDRAVSFVTHRETDDGWRSVVATGELESADEMPYASSTVQGMWGIESPRIDIFERPIEELTFRDFYLVPDSVAGRKEARTDL